MCQLENLSFNFLERDCRDWFLFLQVDIVYLELEYVDDCAYKVVIDSFQVLLVHWTETFDQITQIDQGLCFHHIAFFQQKHLTFDLVAIDLVLDLLKKNCTFLVVEVSYCQAEDLALEDEQLLVWVHEVLVFFHLFV